MEKCSTSRRRPHESIDIDGKNPPSGHYKEGEARCINQGRISDNSNCASLHACVGHYRRLLESTRDSIQIQTAPLITLLSWDYVWMILCPLLVEPLWNHMQLHTLSGQTEALIFFVLLFSHKMISISMCFVLSWKTWFAYKYVATELPYQRHGVWSCVITSPLSID